MIPGNLSPAKLNLHGHAIKDGKTQILKNDSAWFGQQAPGEASVTKQSNQGSALHQVYLNKQFAVSSQKYRSCRRASASKLTKIGGKNMRHLLRGSVI
jgi:hypothetical protein